MAAIVAMVLLGTCAAPTASQPAEENPAVARAEATRQQQIALRQRHDGAMRFFRVSHLVLRESAPLCVENVRPKFGFYLANAYTYSEEQKAELYTIIDTLRLHDDVEIVEVVPRSSAEAAGLKVEDRVVSLNGIALPPRPTSAQLRRIWVEALMSAPIFAPLRIEIERGRRAVERVSKQEIEIPVELVCNFQTLLSDRTDIDARSSGGRTYVYRGLVNFTMSDDELAFVLAREVVRSAIRLLGLRSPGRLAHALGGLLDTEFGITPNVTIPESIDEADPLEVETLLDYVALVVTASAGYDIIEAPKFLHRLAELGAEGSDYLSRHPNPQLRLQQLERSVTDIKQQLSGELAT